ncbi:hypothetical protein ACFQS1_34905 [Paractinoplanes rhizophilus]|jgi:hypothetical protein|uniref:Uncharacterized protein n=1 Tax=Paractinoplanes rhizophilus TaxID=1416877 RepID=A0ABW2I2U3_9ACTN|nr:hypothetical protein [Actinoplanes sp.]
MTGPKIGPKMLRVDWLPGSDQLRGRCHCGAESVADDPVAMWRWLLAHPDHPSSADPLSSSAGCRRDGP